MASKDPRPDSIDMKIDGTVWIVENEREHRLRRVKHGEWLAFQGSWQLVAEWDREHPTPDDDEDGAEALAQARRERQQALEHEILDWWREVVAALDVRGTKLPDDDDEMPVWLTSTDLVTELFSTWRSVPSVPGGLPSQRDEEKMGPMIEKLQVLLNLATSQGS